jgi:dTDP-glucose 4,6-dehydratase
MKRRLQNVLVTGGAGFIGANFIRKALETQRFAGRIVNVDALTYAGNLDNLADLVVSADGSYVFAHIDIRDFAAVRRIFREHEIDTVVHFAAESHVDRSILGPKAFVETNILGTFNLLEAARDAWGDAPDVLFHHVSTDEVFGSLGKEGFFREESPYTPKSPYSASKASSDHLVRAWHHTYGIPVTISNCSNNYGPYQLPEKMIPLMILNMVEGKPLPVYGDGSNVRDWLYVEDHVDAVLRILEDGVAGETYLVGGSNEWSNIALIRELCEVMAEETGEPSERYRELITFVTDRPGHDRRYAIDASRIRRDLGWVPRYGFRDGLRATVRWYLDNTDWTERVRSGEYAQWIEKNYAAR